MLRFLKRLAADVPTPAVDKVTLFVDTTGAAKLKNEAGTVTSVGGGISEALIDAAGDLIVGTAADTAGRLAKGAALQVLRVNAGATALEYADPSGSGSTGWVQVVDEPGTSFAAWTAVTGTWASDGTTINQTALTASALRAYKTASTGASAAEMIVEAEIMFPSASQGAAALYGGIIVGTPPAGVIGNILVRIARVSGVWRTQTEADSVAGVVDDVFVGVTGALDTWFKLRAVKAGSAVGVYLDGVYQHSSELDPSRAKIDRPGLWTNSASVKYRNIKVWARTADLPA